MLLGVEKRGKEELRSVLSSTFEAFEAGIVFVPIVYGFLLSLLF